MLNEEVDGTPDEIKSRSASKGDDMPKYLRTEKGRYIYSFECPLCGSLGEVGIPVRSTQVIDHGCGMLYVQLLPTGMFQKPRLIEVNEQTVGRA